MRLPRLLLCPHSIESRERVTKQRSKDKNHERISDPIKGKILDPLIDRSIGCSGERKDGEELEDQDCNLQRYSPSLDPTASKNFNFLVESLCS